MKKLIGLILVVGLFFVIQSCHDDVSTDGEFDLKSGAFKQTSIVNEVQYWFESNKDENGFFLLDYADQINWKNAQVMEIDNSIVVEVKLKLKGKYRLFSEKVPDLNFEQRLLFIKQEGKLTSYLEFFISKREQSYLDDVEQVNYLRRDGNFAGTILLLDSKGNIKQRYFSTGNCDEVRLKNADETCYELIEIFSDGSYVVIANWGCNGGGGDGSSTEPGSGSTPGGSAGGGGSGSVPATPIVNNILKTCYLNATQKNQLEQALASLISEGCLTRSVYDDLVEHGIKLDFKINSSLTAPASYSPVSKSVDFRSSTDIKSSNLKEELFHAFQDVFYSGGIAQYTSTGKVNIEFEAKLYKDIMAFPCCDALNIGTAPESLRNSYNIWVYSIQENSSNLSDSEYQFWLNQFNIYAAPYSSSASPSLSSPRALKSIISICH